MDKEEQIAVMFGLAENQQNIVSQLLKNLDVATKGIKTTVDEALEEGLGEHQATQKKAVTWAVVPFKEEVDALEARVSQISATIEQTGQRIDQHLHAASDRLKVKLLVTVALTCFACVGAVLGACFWLTHDIREMRANIQVLEAQGGNVHMSRCDGELFVQVDEQKRYTGKNGSVWHVVK